MIGPLSGCTARSSSGARGTGNWAVSCCGCDVIVLWTMLNVSPQDVSLSAYTVCREMLSKNPHACTVPSQMHTVTLRSIMHACLGREVEVDRGNERQAL